MRRKTSLNLIIIIVIFVLSLGIVFPGQINKGIDFLNSRVFSFVGIKLPKTSEIDFKLGLDLQGGTRLLYEADLSDVPRGEEKESMAGLRDVIERRINYFGVKEPIVRVEERGSHKRLIVELAGVKKTEEAIKMIGETPFLEFREEVEEVLQEEDLSDKEKLDAHFKTTELTGKYLKKARLDFGQTTMEPEVILEFNSKGKELFGEITERNVGKRLAIYIDDIMISAPVVREKISGGQARITGKFSLEEAKELVRNLNAGALPVPIEIVSQNTVGPTLGMSSLNKSLKAGLFGFLSVAVFMILIYRLSGLLAFFSLLVYGGILLSIFKLFPVTLTLAGIGGAILSVGMAVDANVLIFERQKEERKEGESFSYALEKGFSRAWPSIRDSNFTTLIIALIMFSFGTSFVKGFALTLSLGILVSLFSSMFVTKTFLKKFIGTKLEKYRKIWG